MFQIGLRLRGIIRTSTRIASSRSTVAATSSIFQPV
jgi:hypothetical protein